MSNMFSAKFILSEKKSDRKKKPRFCEVYGNRKRPRGYKELARYPKPKQTITYKDPEGKKAERCRGEPYELIEIDSFIPSCNPLNPNPVNSGKWVAIRTYEWLCRDCAAEWNYGIVPVKCKKCGERFYSTYHDMLKGIGSNNTRTRPLYCPYCRSPVSEWKRVGKNKYRLYENGKPTNEYNINGEWSKGLPRKRR